LWPRSGEEPVSLGERLRLQGDALFAQQLTERRHIRFRAELRRAFRNPVFEHGKIMGVSKASV
jgi:hypothetical protein